MQFSCESCKAHLQIADEKVRGKRLVVRCKRCGAKIALADPMLSKAAPRVIATGDTTGATGDTNRGSAAHHVPGVIATGDTNRGSAAHHVPGASGASSPLHDTDTESTRAMDSDVLERALRASRADDAVQNGSPPTQRFAAPPPAIPPDPAVWFAMLHGKQTGPLTRTDLELRANEGELGPRTYVWCEGMDAWQRAKDVLELAALFPQLPAPPPPPMTATATKSHATPSRGQTIVTVAHASTVATDPGATTAPGPGTQPHLHPTDQGGAAAPGHAATAEHAPPPKEATAQARPTPTVLPRAVTFGNAVAQGQGPFIVFLALMALAVGAIVLWIVLGAVPQKPPEPRSEGGSSARVGPRVQTGAPATRPAEPSPATAFIGLTADQVRRKLDENKPALQDCVDDARRRNPTLEVGTIRVATTIAPTGQVTEARIDRPSVDQSPLGACLKQATKKIVFPQFAGAAFDVEIPISVGAGR
jgi:predicted Zn finger-like uncharacterized protein